MLKGVICALLSLLAAPAANLTRAFPTNDPTYGKLALSFLSIWNFNNDLDYIINYC